MYLYNDRTPFKSIEYAIAGVLRELSLKEPGLLSKKFACYVPYRTLRANVNDPESKRSKVRQAPQTLGLNRCHGFFDQVWIVRPRGNDLE